VAGAAGSERMHSIRSAGGLCGQGGQMPLPLGCDTSPVTPSRRPGCSEQCSLDLVTPGCPQCFEQTETSQKKEADDIDSHGPCAGICEQGDPCECKYS